ncbi:MAG: ergothioneine biosynthesis protein EgtB [Pyrinomonadaceae bacterium]
MQATVKGESPKLVEYYRSVRSNTERLCEPLETEDYIPQPIVDVSPPKWNIAHTTWFFEEMILKRYAPDYKVFDPQFSFLFNSYYNSVGNRTQRDHRSFSRPTVKQVFEYRKYVDEAMLKLIADTGGNASVNERAHGEEARSGDRMLLNSRVSARDLEYMIILGLNHEQQHQELFLTDLKYTFSVNPLFPAYREKYAPEESEPPSVSGAWCSIEAGLYDIGYHGDGFCFDNELARHKVYLDDLEISNKLVTNAKFIEFIDAGGYKDFRLWHSEGWDWVNQNGIESPLYWHKYDDAWRHLTLGGLRTLPPDAPVCHVSYYEAAAFAEWKGMRLPTEFEWETASTKLNWGTRWEWTNSAYLPYPGFSKAAGAVGEYNGKFMINQMVLRGASVITPEGHSRPTYRNFFHPHLRWQFTGIRLAK